MSADRGNAKLTWRRTENEGDNSVASDLDVLDRSKDVDLAELVSKPYIGLDLRVGKHNSCSARVLDGELDLATLTSNTT